MAKRKNSTALFEVIRPVEPLGRTRTKSRDRTQTGPSILDRAKIWLKSKLEVTLPGAVTAKATPEKMAANPSVNRSPIGKIVSQGNGNAGASSRLSASQRAIAEEVAARASRPIQTSSSLDADLAIETPATEPINKYPAPASESAIAPLLSHARKFDLPRDPTQSVHGSSNWSADPEHETSTVVADEFLSDEEFDHSPSNESEVYDDVTTRQSKAPVAVAVDSHRRKISLHLTYKAALASVAALLLTLALAIVISQKISRNSSTLLSTVTTDKLKKGPAHPEVLNPLRRVTVPDDGAARTAPQTVRNVIDPVKPDRSQNGAINPNNSSKGAGNGGSTNIEPAPVTPPYAEDSKRRIGYNYAIIQSYPPSEEKMAKEAAVFLNREGVPCTLENGIKGYQQIAIVGLDGFPRVSTADWIAYRQKIQQLSSKYTQDKKAFKAFTPVPKKWDRVE